MTLREPSDGADERTPEHDAAPRLVLFAYGTLKRGYWNHAAHARGFASAESATIRGRLREFPNGIPILEIPPWDVLAVGTPDLHADAELSGVERLASPFPFDDDPDWLTVEGELLVFDEPAHRLAALDALEGFDPVSGLGRYRRVLARVQSSHRPAEITAWVYVGDRIGGLSLIGSSWPPRRAKGD